MSSGHLLCKEHPGCGVVKPRETCHVLMAYAAAALQVWGPFRQENYGRHQIIGKVVMACVVGTYATASVIALGHLGSDDWAEKVSICPCCLLSFSIPVCHATV